MLQRKTRRSEPPHPWKGRYQPPRDVLEPLLPALGGLGKEDLVNAKPHAGENQVIFISLFFMGSAEEPTLT